MYGACQVLVRRTDKEPSLGLSGTLDNVTRWATVRWPQSFRMTASELEAKAGFRIRTEGDTWSIATDESYRGVRPRLLDVHVVVDPSADRDDLAFLDRWGDMPPDAASVDEAVGLEVGRLLDGTPELHQFLEASRLLFLAAPASQLPAFVRDTLLESLRRSLPRSRVVFIDYSSKVHSRTAFVRSIFTAEHAPEWFQGSEQRGFGAMRGLAGSGFQGGSAFIDPLLGALFPWMLGVSLYRLGSGIAVVMFGQVLPWRPNPKDHDLSEMLQASLLSGTAEIRLPMTPSLDVDHAVEALRWWVTAVDRFMGVALDPGLFTNGGAYDAREHMGVLASIERVFASVLAALTATGRDEYTRRLHLFETLDLMEGLRLGGYDNTLDLRRCKAALERIRLALPSGAAAVLLPRCESAVAGLATVGDGFIAERRTGDAVLVKDKGGRDVELPVPTASARLIRVVRNAGHGLSKEVTDPQSMSLLAAHDSVLPTAVSDLGFFHLVRLLVEPQAFERPWAAAAAKSRGR